MAKDSLRKASTPEPFSRSKTSNWVARAGGLPAYIQHIAHDLMEKRGKTESQAIQMAIGIVKRWARGGGKVDANTRAAAAKAVAEWEALKGKAKAKKVTEAAIDDLDAELTDEQVAELGDYAPPVLRESPFELSVDVGDLSLLESVSNPPKLSSTPRRPGESLADWGKRLKAGDRANARSAKAKTRSGKTASTPTSSNTNFESKHPRGRGGEWIRKGTSGREVRAVQRRVGARVDGQFGDRTKAAVEAFQRAHNLVVDGIVGRQTVAAMRGRKDAKRVHVGKLTQADINFLRGHVRGDGRQRRVQEAGGVLSLVLGEDLVLREATLSAADRKRLPKSAFVFPEKAPGPGSYPIPDEEHARNALARSAGKPEEATVRAAVYRKFPNLKKVREAGALGLKLGEDMRLVETEDRSIHEETDLAIVESVDGALRLRDLALIEAATDADVRFNQDGTIDMVLIRPCNGRGLGRRIYEADMLASNAHVFAGVPMYDNHESEAAKRARQGLPRPPSELAGEIREAWWDPNFSTPEDSRLGIGRGAVIGRCMLTEDMEKLVRRLPRSVKTSVNAEATGMHVGTRNGQRGLIVEGIVDDKENMSVDLVTKAGAGGAVASLYQQLVAA